MILDFFIYVFNAINSPLSTALIASHKHRQVNFHFYLQQNISKVSWDLFDSSVI